MIEQRRGALGERLLERSFTLIVCAPINSDLCHCSAPMAQFQSVSGEMMPREEARIEVGFARQTRRAPAIEPAGQADAVRSASRRWRCRRGRVVRIRLSRGKAPYFGAAVPCGAAACEALGSGTIRQPAPGRSGLVQTASSPEIVFKRQTSV